MKVPCTLCGKEVDTTNEDFFMTVRWCLEEMLKLNDVKVDRGLERLVGICSDCWTNKLKRKLSTEDYYWIYNKEV